ncbi:MAG: hypothetical protein U5J99_08480 [Parvularculaceae bacterium]|nr:hypothetical protein [Parvularculaceae bacterium]
MKFSPVILIGAAALAGAGGGVGLRFIVKPAANEASSEEYAKTEASAKKKHDKAGAKGHGEGHEKSGKKVAAKAGQASYFKFSRQFVAPIVAGGEPKAMMILDVMIELAPGADDGIYTDEPKLRDAVLKALLAQSAKGDLPRMLTDPECLETTRGAVLANVRAILGEDARSVLLMDVGYQPF